MDIFDLVCSSASVPATGDSSFVRQCFTYLATCDLLAFTIIAGVLVLVWLIFDFVVKMMED